VIRPADQKDVNGMVAVHLKAFEGFFLTLMGPRFLTLMYGGFIDDGAPAFVADEGGSVVGFVVGAARPAGFFRKMLTSRGLVMLVAAVPALLRAPARVIERLWSGLRYRGESPPELKGCWLLSSIAVDPARGGAGTGSDLIRAFCMAARDAAAPGVYLLTDATGNEGGQRFYLRNGFIAHSTLERGNGRLMTIFWRDLQDRGAAP
jgi:GNAT superfamily N-acetyltransferase